jgi:hypothetical protein
MAQGGTQPNLTGTWRFNVTTDAGTGTPTVTLRQQGDSLSGLYSSQFFGEQQVKGSVKDREFNFVFTTTIEGNSLTVTYRGTMANADSLFGTIAIADVAGGTFTAKRQPAQAPREWIGRGEGWRANALWGAKERERVSSHARHADSRERASGVGSGSGRERAEWADHPLGRPAPVPAIRSRSRKLARPFTLGSPSQRTSQRQALTALRHWLAPAHRRAGS